METPSKPTHQDDLERLIRILSDAPVGGLSIDEIQGVTKQSGDPWSYRTINGLLCDLGKQVAHEKIRTKSGKVTKYQLRINL